MQNGKLSGEDQIPETSEMMHHQVSDIIKDVIQDVIEDTMEDIMGTEFLLEESNMDEVMDLFGTVVMIRAIARLCNIPHLKEQERHARRQQKKQERRSLRKLDE